MKNFKKILKRIFKKTSGRKRMENDLNLSLKKTMVV